MSNAFCRCWACADVGKARALQRSDRARGGRPPHDPVLMFKVLVLQTVYTLSDDQTEYRKVVWNRP